MEHPGADTAGQTLCNRDGPWDWGSNGACLGEPCGEKASRQLAAVARAEPGILIAVGQCIASMLQEQLPQGRPGLLKSFVARHSLR